MLADFILKIDILKKKNVRMRTQSQIPAKF